MSIFPFVYPRNTYGIPAKRPGLSTLSGDRSSYPYFDQGCRRLFSGLPGCATGRLLSFFELLYQIYQTVIRQVGVLRRSFRIRGKAILNAFLRWIPTVRRRSVQAVGGGVAVGASGSAAIRVSGSAAGECCAAGPQASIIVAAAISRARAVNSRVLRPLAAMTTLAAALFSLLAGAVIGAEGKGSRLVRGCQLGWPVPLWLWRIHPSTSSG